MAAQSSTRTRSSSRPTRSDPTSRRARLEDTTSARSKESRDWRDMTSLVSGQMVSRSHRMSWTPLRCLLRGKDVLSKKSGLGWNGVSVALGSRIPAIGSMYNDTPTTFTLHANQNFQTLILCLVLIFVDFRLSCHFAAIFLWPVATASYFSCPWNLFKKRKASQCPLGVVGVQDGSSAEP